MKRKKILAIDQGEHLGGAERFFSDVLSHVSEDFDIHLITDHNEAYHNLYKGSKVTLHETPLPKLKPIGLRTYKAYRQTQSEIENLIHSIAPDLIISNTVRTHLLISPLAKKLNLPLIWMAHDLTFPKILLGRFLKYPDVVLSCSQFVQRWYQLASKKTQTIFEVLYPFAIEQSKVDQLKEIKKQKMIGFVGKYIPWKGQEAFLRMAHQVHKKHPEYHFKMITSPYEGVQESEQFMDHCMKLQKEILPDGELSVLDHVDDLLQELAHWEMLVHCSQKPEPLGRVILEGMAAGCTVIASPLGGPSEVLDDGKTGLLSQPTENELTAAVLKLIADREQSERLASRAQQHIQADFTWDKTKERFSALLSGL